jgi:tRNA pseudouridine38-40 synthase
MQKTKKHKVVFQYDGTRFLGWQKQKDFTPTVQEEIERALNAIFKVSINTVGSGRTDTGVHCLEQHVVFSPPFFIPEDKIVKALNANLNRDIRAISCTIVDDDFRPTNDAISREYRYLFTNNGEVSCFQERFIPNISHQLDFDAMKSACELFKGKHDFQNYYCQGSDINSTVREIFECELLFSKLDFHGILGDHWYIRIKGNGFLKQMVRLIVGVIWKVGMKKMSLEEVERSLAQKSDKHFAAVAPAHGLYKFKVEYP